MEKGERIRIRKARQVGRSKKARTYYRVNGGNGPDWDIPNNDIETVTHAVLERVFFVKDGKGGFQRAPKPWSHSSINAQENPVAQARSYVQDKLSQFSREMERCSKIHGVVSPCTNQEFVECYGGAKRKIYEQAVESLESNPLQARDKRVKVFTKDEYLKPDGAPRAIQPRSPRFNVCLGRYVKQLEHLIFEAINEIFDGSGEHKTVAKGMNMNERGEEIRGMWEKYVNPVAVGLDASRFDQHINTLLLEHEHKIYRMWSTGQGDDLPNLNTLLSAQLKNKGVYVGIDGILKYKVNGCRMSGDMNTSLGNVIIMCSLMYSYFKDKNMLGKISLLNDGDDCVIIMEQKRLKEFTRGLKDWFLRMGITMEFDGVYNTLEEVEFCQARPVFNEELGYVLTPRPSKRLYSDVISTKMMKSKKVYRKQLGAIAGCGLAMSGGVPIFQQFYTWMGRGATPWVPKMGDHYYKFRQELIDGMTYKQREPTMRERISFYFAHGITPAEQKLIENYYQCLPDPLWSKPVIDPERYIDSVQYLVEPEQKFKRLS
ncbi:hypothetical protein 2 [Beihai tombus-like virus 4]|uniref:hypothetical protein 2 n=1 Tax=Beihai tombus-like virus 4 TaxID=1922725 RepID=UPI00090A229F|nr:hypothetical protein 2 [Beihai tombus-like virus 4]APG76194.1 hypothetical protein 2 [Beihai tombus-like virus 4]APG76651.1 hypothetical protein 2 [Beihai tombus-like virus 4]